MPLASAVLCEVPKVWNVSNRSCRERPWEMAMISGCRPQKNSFRSEGREFRETS